MPMILADNYDKNSIVWSIYLNRSSSWSSLPNEIPCRFYGENIFVRIAIHLLIAKEWAF